MKPTPRDWPRISSSITYQDANAAIDWLCTAFGFSVRLKVDGEGGRVEHSELEYGEGLIMVGDETALAAKGSALHKSPKSIGGVNTQAMCIFVDDVETHCETARTAGATITVEPKTSDYGEAYWTDRSYQAADPEGHLWWFMQRLRTGKDA